MKSIATLIACLPEVLKLIAAVQKAIHQAETDRKVKEDLQAITKAFHEKDAAELNRIFNSR